MCWSSFTRKTKPYREGCFFNTVKTNHTIEINLILWKINAIIIKNTKDGIWGISHERAV